MSPSRQHFPLLIGLVMAKEKKWRSLRFFVFLIVGLSLGLFTTAFFAILYTTLPQMLLQAETRYLERQVDVVRGLLAATMRDTYLMSEDTGLWDETVRFAQGVNPNYIQNNWPDSSPEESYRYNFIIIKNLRKEDVYIKFFDYIKEEHLPVPPQLSKHLNILSTEVEEKFDRVQKGKEGNEQLGKVGIVFFQGVAYVVASCPILESRESKEIAGTIFFGHILNDEFFKNVTHNKDIVFNFTENYETKLGNNSLITRESENISSTAIPLQDINGKNIVLTMQDNRIIYTEGKGILNKTGIMLIITIILFTIILYRTVIRYILLPIERLSSDINEISLDGGIVVDKYSKTKEFITLCTAIKNMLYRIDVSNISMGTLQRILDGLDIFLYVSDQKTKEILFINNKLKEKYHIPSNKQEWWETLNKRVKNKDALLPVKHLETKDGNSLVWENYDPKAERYYRNTDSMIEWSTGKMVHLHHSVDITDIKNAEFSLKKRLGQQELMSSISKNFISIDDFSASINNSLRMTGEFLGLSKIVLAQFNYEQELILFKYEWLNDDKKISSFMNIRFPFKPGNIIYEKFVNEKSSCLTFNDISTIKEFHLFSLVGLQSLLCIPIYNSENLWGVLNFEEHNKKYTWTESDIQLGKLIGSIISAAITRHVMEKKLISPDIHEGEEGL